MQQNDLIENNYVHFNQNLIRKFKKIKTKPKYSKYLVFINTFFKALKKKLKISPTLINNLPLIYGFLTEYGKIKPYVKDFNFSMKKHKNIAKLIKYARKLKIIPNIITTIVEV